MYVAVRGLWCAGRQSVHFSPKSLEVDRCAGLRSAIVRSLGQTPALVERGPCRARRAVARKLEW
jgi:hypothetical protein